jgi:hypothetical protein|tara:strand:- start:325 stop:1260 length:936 start_codon:yes stop_codon:yes gene_type:complete
MNEDLNIVLFYTQEFAGFLKYLYLPSVPKDIDDVGLHCEVYEDDKYVGLTGRTEIKDYQQMMKDRVYFYYDVIRQNIGKNLLFTDIDIVYLRSFKENLLSITKDYDMAFQGPLNEGGVTLGFFFVKSSDAVVKFFEEEFLPLLDKSPEERQGGYPDIELNQALSAPDCSVKHLALPRAYGYRESKESENIDPYFYHAMGVPPGCLSYKTVLSINQAKFIKCSVALYKFGHWDELRLDPQTVQALHDVHTSLLDIPSQYIQPPEGYGLPPDEDFTPIQPCPWATYPLQVRDERIWGRKNPYGPEHEQVISPL